MSSKSSDLIEDSSSLKEPVRLISGEASSGIGIGVPPPATDSKSMSISGSSGNFSYSNSISDNDIRRCNVKIIAGNETFVSTEEKVLNICKVLKVTYNREEKNMIEFVLWRSGITKQSWA